MDHTCKHSLSPHPTGSLLDSRLASTIHLLSCLPVKLSQGLPLGLSSYYAPSWLYLIQASYSVTLEGRYGLSLTSHSPTPSCSQPACDSPVQSKEHNAHQQPLWPGFHHICLPHRPHCHSLLSAPGKRASLFPHCSGPPSLPADCSLLLHRCVHTQAQAGSEYSLLLMAPLDLGHPQHILCCQGMWEQIRT